MIEDEIKKNLLKNKIKKKSWISNYKKVKIFHYLLL